MGDIFELFKRIGSRSEPEKQPVSYLVVCLGNPGKEYALTRHNSGFLFAEYFALQHGFSIDRARFDGLCGETVYGGQRLLFLCPTTYMNLSGVAVRKAAEFYKLPVDRIVVFCDDVNFDVGTIRIRKKGSDGGQKGVRSIIEQLQSDEFPRVKIGVGKKPRPEYEMADWVLGKFSREDLTALKEVFARCDKALEAIVSGDIDGAMSRYNGNGKNEN